VKRGLERCANATVPAERQGRGECPRKSDMANQEGITLELLILAVIRAIAVIAVVGMWLMHATMMAGMMGCGGLFVVLLIIAALVIAGIVLVRRQARL
jgi:hypothetical protein